jgi:cytoskeletal protein CcmA (bactofilin family)
MALWNKQEPSPEPTGAVTGSVPVAPPAAAPKLEERPALPATTRAELPANSAVGGTSDLLLGAGAEFEGKLTFKGTVRIDARFTGSIVTNDVLVVGEHARMNAEITCGTVVVMGEVNGNIKAKSAVELHRTARVRGDVETPSLTIEKGAMLQGSVKMTDAGQGALVKPLSMAGAASSK